MVINNLVETHCHILPAIDDGSQSIETSLAMINRLKQQGAKKIILTPHYYSNTISLDDFLKARNESFEKLSEALVDNDIELIPAAEVYISQYLFNNKNIDELCIGNSNYVLIEHPFSAPFGESDFDRLMNLYCDYGVKPIMAHIERYKSLMDEPEKIEALIDMGAIIQVNISSFIDAPFFIRRKLFKYLNSGLIHIVGSDSHNLESRPPEYEDGIKAIIKKCGEEAVETLMYNANELVK